MLKNKWWWAAVAVFAYLFPLGFREMFVPDEYRYAEIPREMLASGDWVVPRLCGLRYFEKPPGAYWLSACSFSLFGENAFAARLPSAVSALLTSLLLLLLARRMTGDRTAGVFSAFIFLSCFLTGATAQINLLDFPFTLFVTASLTAAWFALTETERFRRRFYLVLAGLAVAAAFLTKGFLAVVLPVLILLPFLVWERRWLDFFKLLPLPLIAALAGALPWAIAVHRAEPAFWNYFFFAEHVQRFLGASQWQHTEPFWFFAGVMAWATLPWLLVLPFAARGLSRAGAKSAGRFCLCWLVPPFLFFSASKGKLAPYILPCLAPFAILCAIGLAAYFASGARKGFDRTAQAVSVLILLMTTGFVVYQYAFPLQAPFAPGETYKVILTVAALLTWATAAWFSGAAERAPWKILLFSLGPLALFCVLGPATPTRVEEYSSPRLLLKRNAWRAPPASKIFVTVETAAPTCWQYRRADDNLLIVFDEGELQYGLSYPDSRHRYLAWQDFSRMAKGAGPGEIRTAVLRKRFYLANADQVPPYDYRDEQGNFVFLQYYPWPRASGEKENNPQATVSNNQ